MCLGQGFETQAQSEQLPATFFSEGSIRLLDSQHSRNFFRKEKILMLLMLINGAGERKVDSGLKMLIKPI